MTKILLQSEPNRLAVLKLIAGLDISKPWSVEVKCHTKKRTLNQSSLYFLWCGVIARETGNSQDDVHSALKAKFCPVKPVSLEGVEIPIQSTTRLEVAEMSEYMRAVEGFANTELGILLPAQEGE